MDDIIFEEDEIDDYFESKFDLLEIKTYRTKLFNKKKHRKKLTCFS